MQNIIIAGVLSFFLSCVGIYLIRIAWNTDGSVNNKFLLFVLGFILQMLLPAVVLTFIYA